MRPVFRGQHGLSDHRGETLRGSLSFGPAEAASHDALYPNDQRHVALATKVFPVYLHLCSPFFECLDDPFMDLSYCAGSSASK